MFTEHCSVRYTVHVIGNTVISITSIIIIIIIINLAERYYLRQW